eukprot:TRINITY_DN3236_c0_g1_i1.p1 TRINITY_DN3236_c0_g1~~TRINITY_DN3236_c0_g1_i1.p1  ORF type:complete len:264 (+),score=49.59 TRINITY_DN3236_c0_g1_i1:116-907(+)
MNDLNLYFWQFFLQKIQMSAADLLGDKPIVTIKSNDRVNDAFKVFFQANVLSVPVLSDSGKVIGLLDMEDVIFFAISICKTSQELGKYFGGLTDEQRAEFVELDAIKLISDEDISKLSSQGITIDSAGFITNFSQRNQLVAVSPSTSVEELAAALCTTHRVVVLDGDKLLGIITQSDMVKYLSEQDKFSHKTLQELDDVGSENITTIKEDQKVLEAFRDMALNRSNACAVVDSNGKLVSNLSSLDIRVWLFFISSFLFLFPVC